MQIIRIYINVSFVLELNYKGYVFTFKLQESNDI